MSRIKIAFWINLLFAIFELITGFLFNSMIILSDAVHDFSDAFSLGLAVKLENISKEPADRKHPYGHKRFNYVSGLIMAIVMIVSSVLIFVASWNDLWGYIYAVSNNLPVENAPLTMGIIVVAIVGLIVNGIAFVILKTGKELQEKVMSFHLLEDVLGWVAVLALGLIMQYTEWYWIDSVWGLVLSSFFIIRMSIIIIRKIFPIISQTWPKEMIYEEIVANIETNNCQVVDLKIWTINTDEYYMDLKVRTNEKNKQALNLIKQNIRKNLDPKITDSTIEIF